MNRIRINRQPIGDEGGYVLVGALVIMLLLMIVGISATTNTSLELQIAGNDRTHKETFYQADGGTQIAVRLVEESLGTPGGFTAVDANGVLVDPLTPNNTIQVVDPTISENETVRNQTNVFDPDPAAGLVGGRDIGYFPQGFNPLTPNAIPHTNIIADGVTSTVSGSGLQMLAGYEGKGKGTAGGGVQILYTIFAQHFGVDGSESVVRVEWRHLTGLELEGRY